MLGKFFKKPSSDLDNRVPPGQHLTEGFPVLTYGPVPEINFETWQFQITGLASPLVLSWSELMALPSQEFTADFHCVTRWSRLDAKWTGIKITDVLNLVKLDPQVTHVLQHCYGGYTTNLPLSDFVRDENFLAFKLFDEPLASEHGGPLRSVVPHLYAWKSAKWINGLEFLAQDEAGFWERNGYHHRGDPWLEERYSDS